MYNVSTGPTLLTLDYIWLFTSNETKFSAVIDTTVGYRFSRKSLAWMMDARWSGNANCYIFKIPPKNQIYVSLIWKDQKHQMC